MLYLASCSNNIKLFEAPSYDLKYEYDPYYGSTVSKSMTVSEHGELFATVPQEGSIEVVAFKNDGWNKFQTIQNVSNPTVAAFQHTVKRHLAIGTKSGDLLLYDLKKNCVRKALTPANDEISLLDFCAKDSHLAAGCLNGDILLYSMGSNITTEKLMVRATSNSVSAIRFHSLQRSLFAAANDEGDVVVWDINTKRKKFGLKNAHAAPCADVAFSPRNYSFMTSVGYDCTFNCYDLQNNVKVVSKLMDHPLRSQDIMSNGIEIAMGTRDGLIYILDLRNCNNILATVKAGMGDINNLTYKVIGDTETGSFSSLSNCNKVKDQNIEEDNLKSIDTFFSHALNSPIINLDTVNHSSPHEADNSVDTSVDSFLHAMGIGMPSNLSFTSIGDDCVKEIISEGTNEWVETKANLMDGTVTIDNTVLSPFKIADSETTEITSAPLNTDVQSIDVCVMQESCSEKEPQKKYGNTIDHLADIIKKQNDDMSEKMRFEFMNMKLCLVKQFIYHEQRMNLIFQKLMDEIKQLKTENDDLRTKIRY